MKNCRLCLTEKLLADFYRRTNGTYFTRCKKCFNRKLVETKRKNPHRSVTERENRLKTTYGITNAAYDRMVIEQGGGWAICRNVPAGEKLHVDHDHATGKVRALLCGPCNRMLGCARDNPGVLVAGAEYVEAFRG